MWCLYSFLLLKLKNKQTSTFQSSVSGSQSLGISLWYETFFQWIFDLPPLYLFQKRSLHANFYSRFKVLSVLSLYPGVLAENLVPQVHLGEKVLAYRVILASSNYQSQGWGIFHKISYLLEIHFSDLVGQGFSLRMRKVKVKVKLISRVQLFATPWTVAHQAPLSMGFSRQEYWSGLPRGWERILAKQKSRSL